VAHAYHSTPLDLAVHALGDPTGRVVVSRLAEEETPVGQRKARAKPLVPAGAGTFRRGGQLDGIGAATLDRAVRPAGNILGQTAKRVTMEKLFETSSLNREIVLVKALKHPPEQGLRRLDGSRSAGTMVRPRRPRHPEP